MWNRESAGNKEVGLVTDGIVDGSAAMLREGIEAKQAIVLEFAWTRRATPGLVMIHDLRRCESLTIKSQARDISLPRIVGRRRVTQCDLAG